MAKKRRSAQITGRKWLVRAANGDLYVISSNNPPVKLVGAAKTNAKKILATAEGELSHKIPQTMQSLASGVWLSITEAFGQPH
jgi:hypothetical protein